MSRRIEKRNKQNGLCTVGPITTVDFAHGKQTDDSFVIVSINGIEHSAVVQEIFSVDEQYSFLQVRCLSGPYRRSSRIQRMRSKLQPYVNIYGLLSIFFTPSNDEEVTIVDRTKPSTFEPSNTLCFSFHFNFSSITPICLTRISR